MTTTTTSAFAAAASTTSRSISAFGTIPAAPAAASAASLAPPSGPPLRYDQLGPVATTFWGDVAYRYINDVCGGRNPGPTLGRLDAIDVWARCDDERAAWVVALLRRRD